MFSANQFNQFNQNTSFIHDGRNKTLRDQQNENIASHHTTVFFEGRNPAIDAYAISQSGVNFKGTANSSNGYNVRFESDLLTPQSTTNYRVADLDHNESIATYKANANCGSGVRPNLSLENRGGIDTREYGVKPVADKYINSRPPMPKADNRVPIPLIGAMQEHIKREAYYQASANSGMHTRNVFNDDVAVLREQRRRENANAFF